MSALDWAVLVGTIGFIVLYGAWKTRGTTTMDAYFRGDYSLRWPTIGLSIMATQASAITFLSTPGQAYEDGMRFVQFYFGLPLAMVVIIAVFVPIFYRLKVTRRGDPTAVGTGRSPHGEAGQVAGRATARTAGVGPPARPGTAPPRTPSGR